MEKEIILREKEKSFHISRIPRVTKDEIIEFADEEFCGDYGMALKSIWDNFKMWKLYFDNLNYKLDYVIEKISTETQTQTQNKPEQKEGITLLSGKTIKGRKNSDGSTK